MNLKSLQPIELLALMKQGNKRALAKLITVIENGIEGNEAVLESLQMTSTPIVGITGPPGAGKSTLVNELINFWTQDKGFKVAVLAVDPSSPFNLGALLGDRLRMSEHFNNDQVFIRSMATRGALGGLTHKIVETADLMRNAGFDIILIETVGVGQSEIEIAGLADTTVLVLVPEAGDEVQAIKSGVMEIADIFVVNKADREDADKLVRNLKNALHHRKAQDWNPPVIKTSALKSEGIVQLADTIAEHAESLSENNKKAVLLSEKAWNMIAQRKMTGISKKELEMKIATQLKNQNFNLYSFVNQIAKENK